MKIGIYNRYWNTCGGGENYTGSVAEVLSKDHDVELISVESVDWNRIQSRLQLDLSNCSKRQWPNDSCAQLSLLSAQYDFFINSTYASTIVPRSRKSALICYFPHRIDAFAVLRARTTKWVKRFLSMERPNFFNLSLSRGNGIIPIAGVFPVEQDGRAWLGHEAILAVAGAQSPFLQIPMWLGAYNGIERITADGDEVQWSLENNTLSIKIDSTSLKAIMISLVCKTISPAESGFSTDSRQLGACIDTRNIFWVDNHQQRSRILQEESPSECLRAYDRIISISKFTTEWIDKRWQLPSSELQPPIDINIFSSNPSIPKEKIILAVGRFFAGGHNKKHHEIASAFIRMRHEGRIPDGWRLIFVGARHRELKMHTEYFERLQKLCIGHPIDIMPDLPFADLLSHYQRASIYWHAAGWGEKVERFPERFEHFGITTCEAMACGCVPVVFDAAGQKEIVATDELGFRYSSYAMLAQQMEMLTNANQEVLQGIGRKAQHSIVRYSRANFAARVKEAFRGLAY